MRRLLSALLLALALALTGAPLALAHPLGNFTVNHYSRLEIGRERVLLRYVLDLAEIPTLQALRAVGVSDLELDEASHRRLLADRTAGLAAGAHLELDGRAVAWTVQDASLELLPGQVGLPTMRVVLTLVAPLAATDGARLSYRDANEPGRVGWHEVVLRGVDGVGLAASSAPADDVTDELRRYPADPAQPPLDVTTASARLDLAGATLAASGLLAADRPASARFAVDTSADRLTALLRERPADHLLTLLLVLAVAAALGALHALGPGHGKTVVGAYLVGSRGTALQAVFLGLTVTITHTLGVYVLGLVTLVAAQYVLPERLYPALGVLSGLLVVAIGLSLARARLRAALGRPAEREHAGHDDHRHHDTAHHHSHEGAVHRHGGRPHRHDVPGADGSPVTLKSLLALGISGGLLPCPSALVVLLAAISFHDVLLGLTLVAAFSVGLAAVLTGIGLLMVYGGRWLGRSQLAGQWGGSPLVRATPALSALAITAAGLAIAIQAVRGLG